MRPIDKRMLMVWASGQSVTDHQKTLVKLIKLTGDYTVDTIDVDVVTEKLTSCDLGERVRQMVIERYGYINVLIDLGESVPKSGKIKVIVPGSTVNSLITLLCD